MNFIIIVIHTGCLYTLLLTFLLLSLSFEILCSVLRSYLPPPYSSQTQLLFFVHQTSKCPLIFSPIKSNLCCPYILKCLFFHWSVVHLQETIVLEKTDSSSPRHSQLPIVPQKEVVSTSSLYAWSFSDLQGFCACYNICFEFIYEAALLHLEDNLLILTNCLCFLQCFSPLFHSDPTMNTPAVGLSTAQYGHIFRKKFADSTEILNLSHNFSYGEYERCGGSNSDISALLEIIFP